MKLARVRLDSVEAESLLASARDYLGAVKAFEDLVSLDRATTYLPLLPDIVREFADRLRSDDERTVGFVMSGVRFGALAATPTPRSFGEYESDERSRLANAVVFLCAAAVGTPFCFASQQQARLVLDVFPLPGHEVDQLGCSSTTILDWHNEDAFHPLRADYSLLLCIRNDQSAATRLIAAADLRLDGEVEAQLRTPQFAIVPDISHSYSYNFSTSGVAAGSEAAFRRVGELARCIPRTAVLTGDRDDPQIRVDFPYMPQELHSPAANSALAALRRTLQENSGTPLVLTPGDILIFDNRRCVHGRDGFRARYDGTDRWLRRLNISRDSSALEGSRVTPETLRVA